MKQTIFLLIISMALCYGALNAADAMHVDDVAAIVFPADRILDTAATNESLPFRAVCAWATWGRRDDLKRGWTSDPTVCGWANATYAGETRMSCFFSDGVARPRASVTCTALNATHVKQNSCWLTIDGANVPPAAPTPSVWRETTKSSDLNKAIHFRFIITPISRNYLAIMHAIDDVAPHHEQIVPAGFNYVSAWLFQQPDTALFCRYVFIPAGYNLTAELDRWKQVVQDRQRDARQAVAFWLEEHVWSNEAVDTPTMSLLAIVIVLQLVTVVIVSYHFCAPLFYVMAVVGALLLVAMMVLDPVFSLVFRDPIDSIIAICHGFWGVLRVGIKSIMIIMF